MNARLIPATLAFLSLALLLSCGEDSVTDTDTGPKYSRETPEGLVQALAYSMEHKDIDLYDECLHDEFLFTFTPEDAEMVGIPADQPWWGKTPDVSAMNEMFKDPIVVEIECDLPVNGGPWTIPEGVQYRLEPTMKFTLDQGPAAEDSTLFVFSSWFYVKISRDPYDGDKWVFRAIQETLKDPKGARSGAGSDVAAVEATTFGSVKARYK